MTPAPVNLAEKLALLDEAWKPARVGRINDVDVKVVRLEGEFVWHKHDVEDEMFLVVEGVLNMEFRDRIERIGPGEFIIVPAGVEHRPVTETAQVGLVLIEKAGVVNTGDAAPSALTRTTIEDL